MAFTLPGDQAAHVRRQLGLPPSAGGAEIVDATAAMLELLSEPPAAPAYAGVPEGCVVVDQAKLDEMADQVLDAYRGKYLPENREAWRVEFLRAPAATLEHFESAAAMCELERWRPDESVNASGDDDDPLGIMASLYGARGTERSSR